MSTAAMDLGCVLSRTALLCIAFLAAWSGAYAEEAAIVDEDAIAIYGEDYPIYVGARRAQLDGDFKRSIKLYDELKSPLLVAVARIELAACHEALGHLDAATAAYDTAIRDPATDSLLGDAFVRQAAAHCLRGDLQAAEALLDRALQWHDERQPKASANEPMESPPDVGNLCPDLVSERTVLHPDVTPWLMPHLQARALALKVFVQSQLGDTEGALAACDALDALHATTADALRRPPRMGISLRDEAQRGAFVLPNTAWDALSVEHAPKLRFAYFYLVAGECDRASQWFSELDQTLERGGGDALDWSAACMGRGLSQMASGDPVGAAATLDRFRMLFLRSPLAPLGQLALANAHTGTPKGYDDAIRVYSDIASQFPKTPEAERALLAMALCAFNRGDYATALDARQRLQRGYAGTAAAEASNTLDTWVRGAGAGTGVTTKQASTRPQAGGGNSPTRQDPTRVSQVEIRKPALAFELAIIDIRYALSPLEPQAPQQASGPVRLFRSALLLSTSGPSTPGNRP